MIFHLNLPLQSKNIRNPFFWVESFPFKKDPAPKKTYPIHSQPGAANFMCKISINNLPVKVRSKSYFSLCPVGVPWVSQVGPSFLPGTGHALHGDNGIVLQRPERGVFKHNMKQSGNQPQNNPSMLHKCKNIYYKHKHMHKYLYILILI